MFHTLPQEAHSVKLRMEYTKLIIWHLCLTLTKVMAVSYNFHFQFYYIANLFFIADIEKATLYQQRNTYNRQTWVDKINKTRNSKPKMNTSRGLSYDA